MEKYLKAIYKEALKGYSKDEVPVGCIIVKNDKIIAKSHNQKAGKHSVINHAEINCIQKASKRLHDWRLNDCIMFVTLEPCSMCNEVIKQSRIKKVYYLNKSTFNNEDKKVIEYEMLSSEYSSKTLNILKDFFRHKR